MVKKFGFVFTLFSIILGIAFNNGGHAQQATALDADVVVVGAGISGLSAALEAGRGGAKDFGRFGPGLSYKPCKIGQSPFYAIQLFPMTRKSMGGVVIDMSCRVLDRRQQPIPGLYAVGELAGLAGINGKAALEGTFLGPCMIAGRIAGRSALDELKIKPKPVAGSVRIPEASKAPPMKAKSADCKDCHDLESLSAKPRTCYWHFKKTHRVVQERRHQCGLCHAELDPYREENHQIEPLARLENCAICHGVKK